MNVEKLLNLVKHEVAQFAVFRLTEIPGHYKSERFGFQVGDECIVSDGFLHNLRVRINAQMYVTHREANGIEFVEYRIFSSKNPFDLDFREIPLERVNW